MADISTLTAEVDALQGVVPSAVALIDGFVGRMQAAIDAAIAANDEADLSAVQNEVDQIKAEREALANAVANNNPPA